jgi:hypothetical protein
LADPVILGRYLASGLAAAGGVLPSRRAKAVSERAD